MISIERLREMLEYDGERLLWKIDRPRGLPKGSIAGWVVEFPHGLKYVRLKIENRPFPAHRVIWALVHGEWPANQIDHIDGNGLNNKIENLRAVDAAGNARNRKRYDRNTSGVSGVSRRYGKWVARIRVNGSLIYLGSFADFSDAVVARKNAEARFGFHENHGQSRRMNLAAEAQQVALGIDCAAHLAKGSFGTARELGILLSSANPEVAEEFKHLALNFQRIAELLQPVSEGAAR